MLPKIEPIKYNWNLMYALFHVFNTQRATLMHQQLRIALIGNTKRSEHQGYMDSFMIYIQAMNSDYKKYI